MTHNQIKEEFDQDIEQVIEKNQVGSAAINDAIKNNAEIIQSYTSNNSNQTSATEYLEESEKRRLAVSFIELQRH